jgi:hypothetical protein
MRRLGRWTVGPELEVTRQGDQVSRDQAELSEEATETAESREATSTELGEEVRNTSAEIEADDDLELQL